MNHVVASPDHVENMERMFAAVSDLYAEHWSEFFHFAIFEGDEDDWDAAFERTHRRYLEALELKPGDKAIELACGRGGFADYLARNSEAEILGIDISRAQLSQARKRRRPNLRFLHHDIMRVHELGERFDAIVLMDADCYLPDKGLAVARIAASMTPGARFLLVAWCKRQRLGAIQEELVLEPFMRFWGVPSLETAAGYRRHFRKAGLRLVEEEDLNDKVKPNWELGYERAIEGVRDITLAKAARYVWKGLALGPEGVRLVKDQFHAALYIKAAFDAGFLRYTFLLAEKT
jgi:sterol 24-C-methyltransferase